MEALSSRKKLKTECSGGEFGRTARLPKDAGSEAASQHETQLETLQADISAVRQLITCRICQIFMFEPYTLHCGHTYCYSCLSKWLQKTLSCPDCRADVEIQPVPSYVIRDIAAHFNSRAHLLAHGDSLEENKRMADEEANTVANDKANVNGGGLFQGLFRTQPLVDETDGVERCPNCQWEVEDNVCTNCHLSFDGEYFSDEEIMPYDDDRFFSVMDNSEDEDDDDADDDDEIEMRPRFHVIDHTGSFGSLARPFPFDSTLDEDEADSEMDDFIENDDDDDDDEATYHQSQYTLDDMETGSWGDHDASSHSVDDEEDPSLLYLGQGSRNDDQEDGEDEDEQDYDSDEEEGSDDSEDDEEQDSNQDSDQDDEDDADGYDGAQQNFDTSDESPVQPQRHRRRPLITISSDH
ncbi:hypothetical protein K470DRAFT_260493 [Piedraia hortae CBS 480.64]|uniref:RING-type domain-containing protein n=1 Tax=Piedraia hortae CBS 480.64 TaxID=1314780 RepID=A0A6A7BRE6_9PEZI|nr:hypothetical protein K470DRAFT_260493 [Piedraia hortae CBS 480.64]